MANHPPGSEQLVAYFEGKITDAATRAAIESYIAADTEPQKIEAAMQQAWKNLPEPAIPAAPADWDKFRMIAGIRQPKTGFIRPMLAAAATLLLLASLGTFYFISHNMQPAQALVWQEVSAGPRELRKVQLADGSTLTLFPGSVIRYNNLYNEKTREIRLQGRAYFDVAAVANKPFLVTTGHYTTQVLGTSFDIAERNEEKTIRIVLVSGRVRLLNGRRQPVSDLQPNQQLTLHTGNAQFNILPVAAQSTISWTSGRLSYDQVTLEEVCRELAAWYGTTIKIQRKDLGTKRITADFERMPLPTVMHILSETAGFTYREVADKIELY